MIFLLNPWANECYLILCFSARHGVLACQTSPPLRSRCVWLSEIEIIRIAINSSSSRYFYRLIIYAYGKLHSF